MYKYHYSKEQLESIKERAYLSDLQTNIIQYRMKDYSIERIADLVNCSTSKVSREITKINKKLKSLKTW